MQMGHLAMESSRDVAVRLFGSLALLLLTARVKFVLRYLRHNLTPLSNPSISTNNIELFRLRIH